MDIPEIIGTHLWYILILCLFFPLVSLDLVASSEFQIVVA